MADHRLTALGLDEKEQRFYLAALELGASSVTALAAHACVTRTNAYDLLQRLEERGLLSQIGEKGARQVVAEDPNVLVTKWERTRAMLDDLVPELRSVFVSTQHKPRVRYYEGAQGIARVLWQTLECTSPVLHGFLSMQDLLEVPGVEEMDRFIAERARRGITLKVVRSRSRETDAAWPSSVTERRELRYAPESADLGMTMLIHDDCVSYISSKHENYALVIESREMAAFNRTVFETIWSISTPP